MNAEKIAAILQDEFTSPLPPPPPVVCDHELFVPTDSQCADFWHQYGMLSNIADHSKEVARVATFLAQKAQQIGISVDVPTVRASALLHDIAKTYCIKHGGSHSQLGGAWVAQLTANPAIALGVTHHVYWPFEMDIHKYFLPLAVIYADKRIQHDTLVHLEDRFADLTTRYGVNEHIRSRIHATMTKALELETILSETLEVELNECDFDCGRLV